MSRVLIIEDNADLAFGVVTALESEGFETVVAAKPDVMVAGWSYGYDETRQLTPDSLAQRDIAAYVLTESCRQADGAARGIVVPWSALRAVLSTLGRITGHEVRGADAGSPSRRSRSSAARWSRSASGEPYASELSK